MDEFDDNEKTPEEKEELKVYTWTDANLREISENV